MQSTYTISLTAERSPGRAGRSAVEPAVRSNLVIAIGDLALRFPNTLEPWTANMYRPLSDSDPSEPPRPTLVPRCPAYFAEDDSPTRSTNGLVPTSDEWRLCQ